MKRRAGTILLVTLVLLSGCSLLGGSPTATPTGGGDGARSGGTNGDGTTPGDAGTRTPASYPPGYGPSGARDVDRAMEAHQAAMLSHDSFTVTYQASLLTNDGQAAISSLQTTNQTTRRAYVATNLSGDATTVSYVTDGERFTRTNPPGNGTDDVSYERTSATYAAAQYTGSQFIRPALENLTYAEPERIQRESGVFLRYRATEVRNVESLLGNGVNPANVSSFDAAIVVGPDGAVRRMAYRATIDRGDRQFSLSVRMDVSDVDGVTLTDPPWLDEARRRG